MSLIDEILEPEAHPMALGQAAERLFASGGDKGGEPSEPADTPAEEDEEERDRPGPPPVDN